MKKIPKNPYAGDSGDLLPGTAHALELARSGDIGAAQTQLCRALATERLVVPVPKPATSEIIKGSWEQFAPPGFDPAQQPGFTSGFQTKNYYEEDAPPTQSTDRNCVMAEINLEDAPLPQSAVIRVSGAHEGKPESVVYCVSESLGIVYSPVGVAAPVYSSAQTFESEVEASRPVLMNPARVALAALTDGGNLWLDPVYSYGTAAEAKEAFQTDPLRSCETIILGRNALTALACGDDWLAPWDDPEIPGLLAQAAAHTGCEIVASEPFPAGGLNLKLRVPQDLEECKLALKRLQRALSRDLKLTARVTYFSLTPA